MIRKHELPFLFIAALFIILCVFLLYTDIQKEKSLRANFEYTHAVILSFSSGPRGRYYLDYNYFVNGIKYQGSGKHYPKSDILSIGDTIVVVFDKTNPVNSRPERDF